MSQLEHSAPDFEIYIDLTCHLCHGDAVWLSKQKFGSRFRIVNFRSGETGFLKISPAELNKQLYLVDLKSHQIYRGIQSVIFVLSMSPRWRWAASILKFWAVYPLAWIVYRLFAYVRVYLPKRKSCEL